MANSDFNWTDEQIEAAGLDKKRINSVVQRLKGVVKDLNAMRLAIYTASDIANIHPCDLHPQRDGGIGDQDCIIAEVRGPFDGGDW